MNTNVLDLDEISKMKPGYNTPVERLQLLETRDAVHGQLMNKVRLNRYDMRFMVNIQEKYLCRDEPLSPGQNELYEKIIHKYRKQIKKLGARYNDIIALPWKNGIVSIESLNKKTYFKLVDGQMLLYFNFNKQQIEDIRKIVHDDAKTHLKRGISDDLSFGNGLKYDFPWVKKDKEFVGPFSVYLFKMLYDFAVKAGVRIDASAKTIFTALSETGTEEDWTPHMHVVHGRMYISQITEAMLPFLEDIDMTDTSIKNIEQLGKLGLEGPGLYGDIEKYMCCSSGSIKHDLMTKEDIELVKQYIDESGRKAIFSTPTGWIPKESLGSQFNEWNNDNVRHLQNNDSNADLIPGLIEEGFDTLVSTGSIAGLFRGQSAVGNFARTADKVLYISIAGNT